MSIPDVISFLQHPKTTWSSRGHTTIETEFDIKPNDFLRFAELDLAAGYEHSLVNALSNAKRALDSQIDTLLIGFGFYSEAKNKRWGFPTKVQRIKELGIIAPRVLNKINKTRNLMEHEFTMPKYDMTEDFVDIASLFLASTNKYIYDLPGYCELENEVLSEFWINMELHLESSSLELWYIPIEGEKIIRVFEPGDSDYIDLLKGYLDKGSTMRY